MNVLIVDDDLVIVEMYKDKFELTGFVVKCARNGKEALDILAYFVPDVIMLDLIMPEMDGVAFMKKIRQSGAFDSIPIVVLTNASPDSIPSSLWGTRISDYIIKADHTPSDIVEKIHAIVEQHQKPLSS